VKAFPNDIELHRVPLITSSNIEVFDQLYRGVSTALSRWSTSCIKAFRQWRRVVSRCSISCIEVFHQLYRGVPSVVSRYFTSVPRCSTSCIEVFRWHRVFPSAVSRWVVSWRSADRFFSISCAQVFDQVYRGDPLTALFHQLYPGVLLVVSKCSADTELFHQLYPGVLSVVSRCSADTELFNQLYISRCSISCIEVFRWHRVIPSVISRCSISCIEVFRWHRVIPSVISRCSYQLYRGVPLTPGSISYIEMFGWQIVNTSVVSRCSADIEFFHQLYLGILPGVSRCSADT